MRYLCSISLTIMLLFCIADPAYSQDDKPVEASDATKLENNVSSEEQLSDKEQQKLEEQRQKKIEAVEQLDDIQESLDSKTKLVKELRVDLSRASEEEVEAVQAQLSDVESEIELLEKTFEQIAIGDIDLSILGGQEKAFNWREELVLIVQPLIENVKGLTEKPRKIEGLRQLIDEKSAALVTSSDALKSIAALKSEADGKEVLARLEEVENDWDNRFEDLDREIQLAEYQLASLDGKNTPWLEVIREGFKGFAKGRGLTLVLAVLAAVLILVVMRGLLWVMSKRSADSNDRSTKTHYRLAAYGYRLLTMILIAVAVMMVFYFRQDLLLMAIMVVLLIGAALALKNLLPKYITESKLLLNLGSVREKERVIFNGLPWKVSNLNMHSILINPEIRGSIRLPIGQMHEMISRPNKNEAWFPSSEGDWVLDNDQNPVQVMRQTVDNVELRDLDSVTRFMPSAEYFQAGYRNLSRAKKFRVTTLFGIDYATQAENVADIEKAFAEGIKDSLNETAFGEFVVRLQVDFHSAGDSALNYAVLVEFKPQAAKYYNRIERRLQRACVMVCNQQGWGIPFPQVTVHMPNSGSDPKMENH